MNTRLTTTFQLPREDCPNFQKRSKTEIEWAKHKHYLASETQCSRSKGQAETACSRKCSDNHPSNRLLIDTFALNPYFGARKLPFCPAWLRIWASKTIVWGIGCPDALTHSTMVTCPFFPEAHYRTSFVPFTATTFGGLGSSGTPLSSTLS